MFKRNTAPTSLLPIFALAALCLFAADINGQKTPNVVAGAPLKNIDIKLGKNPGGGGANRTTGPDGTINLDDLTPGSYWMELPALSPAQKAANAGGDSYSYIAVTISGTRLVGGTKARSLKITEWKFVNPPPKNTARTAMPVETYTNRIEFEISPATGGPPPEPVQATIVKSKSNICNN